MPLVKRTPARNLLRATIGVVVAVFIAFAGGGCQTVPLAQQRLVAKPEMTFDQSAGGHPTVNVVAQIEPGVATSGGAQAAGCTSCR